MVSGYGTVLSGLRALPRDDRHGHVRKRSLTLHACTCRCLVEVCTGPIGGCPSGPKIVLHLASSAASVPHSAMGSYCIRVIGSVRGTYALLANASSSSGYCVARRTTRKVTTEVCLSLNSCAGKASRTGGTLSRVALVSGTSCGGGFYRGGARAV